eukprot:10940296-Lingulodinium_polyedra.AAC.1
MDLQRARQLPMLHAIACLVRLLGHVVGPLLAAQVTVCPRVHQQAHLAAAKARALEIVRRLFRGPWPPREWPLGLQRTHRQAEHREGP